MIDDLAIRLAILISTADETTSKGCSNYCNSLRQLQQEAMELHRHNCAENTHSVEMYRSKRLIEAIMGVLELAEPHYNKVNDREWHAQEEAADNYERKLYGEPL
jgi:hypothetical protein